MGDIVKYDNKYHVIVSLNPSYKGGSRIMAKEINNENGWECSIEACTESFVFVSELEALLFLP